MLSNCPPKYVMPYPPRSTVFLVALYANPTRGARSVCVICQMLFNRCPGAGVSTGGFWLKSSVRETLFVSTGGA